MADAGDLKSPGPKGRAGSSPAIGTPGSENFQDNRSKIRPLRRRALGREISTSRMAPARILKPPEGELLELSLGNHAPRKCCFRNDRAAGSSASSG